MRGPPPRPSTTPVRAPQSQPFVPAAGKGRVRSTSEEHILTARHDIDFPNTPASIAPPPRHSMPTVIKPLHLSPATISVCLGPAHQRCLYTQPNPRALSPIFASAFILTSKLRILRALHMTSPPGRARLAHIQRLSRVAALHTRAGLEPRPGGEKPPPTHPTPSPNPPPANAA